MSLFLPWKFVCKRRVRLATAASELPFPRCLLCQTFNDFPPFYRASRPRSLPRRENLSRGGKQRILFDENSQDIPRRLKPLRAISYRSIMESLLNFFFTFLPRFSPDFFYPRSTINRKLTSLNKFPSKFSFF